MATAIPSVVEGDPLSVAWSDLVETALAEAQTLLQTTGPAAISVILANWANYGSPHADAQVMRFGDIVVACGLIRNNTGASATPPISGLMTVPSGFRPRVAGAVAPLGGTTLTVNCCSGVNGNCRLDAGSSGSLNVGSTSGSAVIATGGFVATQGVWISE